MAWVLIITILSGDMSDTYSVPFKNQDLCEQARSVYMENFDKSPVSAHRAVVVCARAQ